MLQKFDQVTEETIKLLVDQFYGKVREDNDLRPVFEGAIGTTDAVWKPHLERMYQFWSSVMLISGRYHGNPLKKHRDLPSFDISLFERWLALFEETAKEIHTDEVAAQYKDKSQQIASSLKLEIYFRPRKDNQLP